MSGINDIEKSLREKIAKDLEELETPTSISSDWFAASKRTKMAAIAIVKYGLPQ
jgi:predicted component of type VI protein secretion system